MVANYRALLVYHFAMALILVIAGAFSGYTVQAIEQSSRVTELPTFDNEARGALEKQQDMELLRARALFYFDISRELKRARSYETLQLIYDARRLLFIMAGLFALGGLLVAVLYPRRATS